MNTRELTAAVPDRGTHDPFGFRVRP